MCNLERPPIVSNRLFYQILSVDDVQRIAGEIPIEEVDRKLQAILRQPVQISVAGALCRLDLLYEQAFLLHEREPDRHDVPALEVDEEREHSVDEDPAVLRVAELVPVGRVV